MSPLSTAALTTLAGMPESAPASGTVRVSLSRNGGSSIWLVMHLAVRMPDLQSDLIQHLGVPKHAVLPSQFQVSRGFRRRSVRVSPDAVLPDATRPPVFRFPSMRV